jgi:hypothetical protein
MVWNIFVVVAPAADVCDGYTCASQPIWARLVSEAYLKIRTGKQKGRNERISNRMRSVVVYDCHYTILLSVQVKVRTIDQTTVTQGQFSQFP